jgi:hypothetical protein
MNESFDMDSRVYRNRLWLLAHQDDEIVALHLCSESKNNSVIYLTDGVRRGAKFGTELRIQEAKKVWGEIDKGALLNFFGTKYAIRDGSLVETLNAEHLMELVSICKAQDIQEIVTLQLEGGHQDHDVTSILAEELSRRLKIRLLTFPAYRALHHRFPVYSVMTLDRNASRHSFEPEVKKLKIAIQSISLMTRYRSQTRTWIGLGPFVFLKYLLGKPRYLVQEVSDRKIQDNPTKMLYLNRHQHESVNYLKLREQMSSWGSAI